MKKVLIIGGNSDIGFSLGCLFVKSNFKLILASKNLSELQIKKKIIQNNYNNDNCDVYQFDIENDNIIELLNKINDRIDILIFSNGYFEKPEINPIKIININYLSVVKICEKIIVSDKINDLKNIIILSSVAGDRGKKNNLIYSSAKAGLTSYANGLNQLLYKKKINVMNVKIGWVKTKMTSNLKLPGFLCSEKEIVAERIYKSYLKNNTNLYVPAYWSIIMFVYKLIPNFFFKIFK
ncbi:SDR family NAD(P)-dependent oxidoreductase [Candidatus Pelagibacter bacterium]|nr:SDR family NAD(P)-dependent oxidoreductase [Candidatus Pelagibacter bacterium]